MKSRSRYKRIILKLSGEALVGKRSVGVDIKIVECIAQEIKSVINKGVQLGLVLGGGNFFRGATLEREGISRITGDHLGMIATIFNAVVMRDVFLRLGIPTKIMSALPIYSVVEQFDRLRALDYLAQGFVVIFSGGTGNPLVTTDTALCLRGIELGADLLLKATNVDGVYTQDPQKYPNAKFYNKLTYDQALHERLAVMDFVAFCLGRDHKMKLRVFNIHKKGVLLRIIRGMDEGTLVE